MSFIGNRTVRKGILKSSRNALTTFLTTGNAFYKSDGKVNETVFTRLYQWLDGIKDKDSLSFVSTSILSFKESLICGEKVSEFSRLLKRHKCFSLTILQAMFWIRLTLLQSTRSDQIYIFLLFLHLVNQTLFCVQDCHHIHLLLNTRCCLLLSFPGHKRYVFARCYRRKHVVGVLLLVFLLTCLRLSTNLWTNANTCQCPSDGDSVVKLCTCSGGFRQLAYGQS